jgi:molybdopterin converting factor small subunit
MAIKIQIPTPMREQAGGKAEVEVTGGTVKAALDDLLRQYPAIGPKLFDNGKLRPYINVFLNDEDIRYLDEMDTKVTDGVVLALIPAVAGG